MAQKKWLYHLQIQSLQNSISLIYVDYQPQKPKLKDILGIQFETGFGAQTGATGGQIVEGGQGLGAVG